MKHFLLPALLVLCMPLCQAQKNFPAFGKIDKEDLELKDCEFDKGAEAFKLIDWGSVYYERGVGLFKQITERRVRIKILKDKGTSYANVKTPPFISRNGNEKITKIEANTYNLDAAGNIITTSVDRKSIYTQALNKSMSQVIIAFPEVKAGSVIEYKYKLESDYYEYIDDWYFQDDIPTRISEIDIKAPALFRFKEDRFFYMEPERKQDVSDEFMTLGGGELYKVTMLTKSYVLRNVPGVHDEPYQSTKKDYKQKISFQLSQIDNNDGNPKDIRTSWEDVKKGLDENEDFGAELKKNIPGTETFISETTSCPDTLCKMLKVFNYVRSNMNWTGSDFLYSSQGIRTAWEKKTGNSGEINLILIKLLRDAGVNANPILFSTKDNGVVNTNYPSEKQFNVVMAYVELGNDYYVLNAADKYNSFRLIPYDVAFTDGLILDADRARWRHVGKAKHKFKELIAIQADIDAGGNMKGDATITSVDYAKNLRAKTYTEDKAAYRDIYYTKPYPNVKVEQLEVNNTNSDSLALDQKVSFTSKLNSSGNYSYFNINLFSDLTENPFVADERQTNIDFGYLQEFVLFGNYKIPEGYTFEELPKDVSMIMPDTSIVFSRFISAEDNALSVRINIEFREISYLAQDYDYFREFYKKLFDKLNEQIVIKKK